MGQLSRVGKAGGEEGVKLLKIYHRALKEKYIRRMGNMLTWGST